jgi:hypothetical protein
MFLDQSSQTEMYISFLFHSCLLHLFVCFNFRKKEYYFYYFYFCFTTIEIALLIVGETKGVTQNEKWRFLNANISSKKFFLLFRQIVSIFWQLDKFFQLSKHQNIFFAFNFLLIYFEASKNI